VEVGGASPAPETWSKPPAGPSPSGRAARRRLAAARCDACCHAWTGHPGSHEPGITRCLECAAQGAGADAGADVVAGADAEPCRRRVPRRILRRVSAQSLESSAPWHVKLAHRVRQVVGEVIEAVVDAVTNPF
jgi:hypothetical protein